MSKRSEEWKKLDAGIDVYATFHIQHLESLSDVVRQITGVNIRETIPDRVLDVYRDILDPLISYIEQVNNEEYPNEMVMVVVPDFIPKSIAAGMLPNQKANLLHLRLQQYEDIIIIQVPHHL